MSKRTLTVSFLTAGLTVGVIAGAVGPAAAQGNPVGGSGNVYYLAGAGNTGGTAQEVLAFGDPGDEVFYGDWNNDGTDTPMVRRNNVFYVADKDGKTVDVFAYGNPGDKVIVGDWDGKNGDSLAVVRTEQGTNRFFVKNDVKTTGKADSEYFYGNAGDNILVGDWDGDDKDTLMVARPDTSFHVRNSSGGGVEDYAFTYGNPGDTILVGDWADPANGKSGNGADQIAVRRDGNHYFFSKELGKGADIGTAMRDQRYGEATDTVFAAKLPTNVVDKDGNPVVNTKKPVTYTSDSTSSYAGGEPLLKSTGGGSPAFAQVQNNDGSWATHNAGDPKTHLAGEKKVYLGTEPVVGPDGATLKWVKYDAAAIGNNPSNMLPQDGNVERYSVNTPVLDADGLPTYYVDTTSASHTAQPIKWVQTHTQAVAQPNVTKAIEDLSNADRYITPQAGDPVLHKRGEAINVGLNDAATYTGSGSEYVKVHDGSDAVLDANGEPVMIPSVAAASFVAGPAQGTWTSGAPVAYFTGAATSNMGEIQFTDGSLGSPTAWSWDLGDGTRSNLKNPAHTYKAAGDYTVKLIATSGSGDSAVYSASVRVTGSTRPQTYADTAPSGQTGTVYTKDGGGTTTDSTKAAKYQAGDPQTYRSGEGYVRGWKNLATATVTSQGGADWKAVVLDGSNAAHSDEAPNVYLQPGDAYGNNASKKVADLDSDATADAVYNKGGEPKSALSQTADNTAVSSTTAVAPYKGGEAVIGHHAGDVVLDKDGKVTYTGDDKPLVFTGDALGVRRNFG